ncbi:2-C-methyl-D-erythritol 4-phosphate cytidylyltransferase [Sporolactobacillus sp. THM7-7]|nr:2-C-methyl-D-erythritol 4-phosphate cytidylyltransferase [Sporolactobacillus sp. THM7-7]
MNDYHAVIVAAGQGRRMGTRQNKVLLSLCGTPVIVHTLLVFEEDPACRGIILVVHEQEKERILNLLDHYNITKVIELTDGGKERQDSVYNGLRALGGDRESIVLIHDGARPFIGKDQIDGVVESAGRCGAALLAVPVKNTIKKVSGQKVEKTLERKSLWAAQTPQAFRLSVILQAHHEGKFRHLTATDDASLVEMTGHDVEIVEGSYRNIKLTTPEDMIIAKQFLREEEKTDANRPWV